MIAEDFKRGIFTENPIFILALGLCPALAISTSLYSGIGMGIAVTFVLVSSNIVISLAKSFIPEKVRIPCYIVVIATFVTIVQLLMKAYVPALDKQLGIFVQLIVVNCVILGRAEVYASKNNVVKSFVDGIVIGLGFTFSLAILSIIREVLGSNMLFGMKVIPSFQPMAVFILAPGGFFTIALVMIIVRYYNSRKKV
jgi:electron transport complex protein RnfE